MQIIDTFCCPEKAKLLATPSGSRYHEQYVGKLDKETGDIRLVSVGKIDVYAEIQSHEQEADINVLINRAMNGDLSAFKSAVFGDFTDMPESYADALNVVIESEREFNHLPQEIKDKFDNDWHKYLVTAGSPEWYEKFGIVADPQKTEKKEVSENESEQ